MPHWHGTRAQHEWSRAICGSTTDATGQIHVTAASRIGAWPGDANLGWISPIACVAAPDSLHDHTRDSGNPCRSRIATRRRARRLAYPARGRLAQLVRASRLHREGHWFEPSTAHHVTLVVRAELAHCTQGSGRKASTRCAIRHNALRQPPASATTSRSTAAWPKRSHGANQVHAPRTPPHHFEVRRSAQGPSSSIDPPSCDALQLPGRIRCSSETAEAIA